MATNLTYTNLFSESRNNVVALINSDVSDPISSSGQFRKWIYSRQPDIKSSEFKGYPFIVVPNSDVLTDKEKQSGDGKKRMVNFEIEVEIFTSDRGYGSSDGQGSIQVDSISNEIMTTFLNLANRQTLINNRMSMSDPNSSPVEVLTIMDELVYRRSITLSFGNRMAVSA